MAPKGPDLKPLVGVSKKAAPAFKEAHAAMVEIGKLAASGKDEAKLKELIEKRRQMFDTLRQIIDKYDQTARSVVQSIGK